MAIKCFGYSVRVARGGYLRKDDPDAPAVEDGKLRVRVQIGKERYRELKALFLEMATRWTAEEFGREFFNVPFEPYAPIRVQLFNLLRLVNRARQEAGLDRLPASVIRTKRRIVKPFDLAEGQGPLRG